MILKYKRLHHYSMNRVLLAILAHFVTLSLAYFILQQLRVISILPNNHNLLSWDASWYMTIKDSGYHFMPDRPCNLAFFPLFPLTWKLLAADPIVISIFNLLVFYVSFYVLLKNEKLPFVIFLLLLATPSFVFFSLPYSESLFFLFGVMILRGYERNSSRLKFWGFLGTSLTRSVSLVFIPAILLSELFARRTDEVVARRSSGIWYSMLATFAGTATSALLQGVQTGKWFYFLEVQKFWNRTWSWPSFPLTTYDPQRMLGIEAVSFAVGLIAMFFCVLWAYTAIFAKSAESLKITCPPVTIVLCGLVLSATVFVDTFFTFDIGTSTSIWSLNRHILCTPFAVAFLAWMYRTVKDSVMGVLGIIAIILMCAYITEVYNYHNLLVYYHLFFLPFIALSFYRRSKNYLYILYVPAIILQIQFFQDFLNGRWIA